MGKASKWFKGLLGFRKPDPNHSPAQKPPSKKRWSFAKSHKGSARQKSQHGVAPGGYDDDEANRHAIAVAAATAAVAEAAVAAAQAAAAVMKLTSGGGNTSVAGSGSGFDSVAACVSQNGAGYGSREELAAVMIQSHFRAYLSRRALRALRALVKLQALVRGHISRKQNVDKLRRMQAVVRAQARARAGRVLISETPHSSTKSSHFNHTGRASLENVDIVTLARSRKHEQPMMLKRNGSKSNGNVTYDPEKSNSIHHRIDRRMGETLWEQESFTRIVRVDDERSDKILEVDTEKPHVMTPKRKNIIHSSHRSHSSDQYCQSFSMSKETTGVSPSSGEVQSLSPAFYTADNSPLYYSASSIGGSSKRAPFTPPKSNGSRSFLGGYSEHPSYMAYTESAKAKVRSLSAPKQRPQYERSSSVNRYSVHVYGDSRTNTQKVSPLHSNFANKAYPGSGLLDRLGMPVRDVSGFSGGHWHRY